MSKAIAVPTTNRRGLLAASGAALAGALIGAHQAQGAEIPAAPTGADAELIAACAAYTAARAELDHIDSLPLHGGGPDDPRTVAEEARIAELLDVLHENLHAAASLTARTKAGLKAKALAVLKELPGAVKHNEIRLEDSEIRLTLSIAADVLTMQGAA